VICCTHRKEKDFGEKIHAMTDTNPMNESRRESKNNHFRPIISSICIAGDHDIEKRETSEYALSLAMPYCLRM
jgi:hypothetical protein